MELRTASFTAGVLAALAWLPQPANAQQAPRPLTPEEARVAARRAHPDLAAARSAVDAAAGRTRQARALANPSLSYGYEQTSANGQANSQSIAAVEQPLEFTGVRGARRDAARFGQEAAAADLRAAEGQVDFDATRAYALAQAADARMKLAERTAAAFDQAQRVTGARLAAGDVSGYEARRIRLESARYAALRAEAAFARRTAYVTLAGLVGGAPDSLLLPDLPPPGPVPPAPAVTGRDSLLVLALGRRPELISAERHAAAALAEARAAGRERIPVPVAVAGWKTERPAGAGVTFTGFVAGIALPLPLWDRRGGAVASADADALRRTAEAHHASTRHPGGRGSIRLAAGSRGGSGAARPDPRR